MCLTFTQNWFSEQTVNFENIEVYEQLGKLDLNFLYSKDIICTTSVNERHYRYFSKLRGLFFLFWIISFDNCSIEILLLRQIIKFENTVDSLYLEHPLSRTKVSVPLCRLQPIFLSLSRTNSLVPCEFEIERVSCIQKSIRWMLKKQINVEITIS